MLTGRPLMTLHGEALDYFADPCVWTLSHDNRKLVSIRYYPSPKDAASNIKDHVAFYKVRGLGAACFSFLVCSPVLILEQSNN